jgi:hypothetical protein
LQILEQKFVLKTVWQKTLTSRAKSPYLPVPAEVALSAPDGKGIATGRYYVMAAKIHTIL